MSVESDIAFAWDVLVEERTDDVTKAKRALRRVLGRVARMNDELDDLRASQRSSLSAQKKTETAGRGRMGEL